MYQYGYFCRNTYTVFANFTGLYFLNFTTFSNQSLQLYSFKDALSSCGVGFRSSCLDQNIFVKINFPEQGGGEVSSLAALKIACARNLKVETHFEFMHGQEKQNRQ